MRRFRLFGLCILTVTFLLVPVLLLQGQTSGDDSGGGNDSGVSRVSVFDHFVRQGGPITWFVLIPMSIAMVAMSIHQFLLIRRSALMPPGLHDEIEELTEHRQERDVARITDEVVRITDEDPSMLAYVVHAGVGEAANGHEAMLHAVEEATDERVATLFRRIEHLNVLGNVAPMVGLFGTVYGMIRAFHSLVETGGVPDPAKLALGISVALVTTFWGLLVAIPALAVFAISRNRLDALAPECVLLADDLLRPLFEQADAVELTGPNETEV